MSVSYPVRTPLLYWLVVGVLVVLAAFGLVAFVLGLMRGDFGLIDVLALLLVLVPVTYLATTGEYRAVGAIDLSAGEVSVPGKGGRPLIFRGSDLRLAVTPVKVRVRLFHVLVIEVARGVVLELADASRCRRISTLTLVQREHQDALLADLDRVLRGEAPRGPHVLVAEPSPPRPKSELEAQLDRELAALD